MGIFVSDLRNFWTWFTSQIQISSEKHFMLGVFQQREGNLKYICMSDELTFWIKTEFWDIDSFFGC